MLSVHECCICSQIAGHPDNDLIARLLPDQPYVRRVIMETESFAAIPSLGPLAAGHSLVCPKQHVRSFAQLRLDLHDELADIQQTLTTRLANTYGGDVHVFEHGAARDGDRILCTVDHAHLHFIPCATDVVLEPALDDWVPLDDSLRSLHALVGGGEYLFYEAPSRESRAFLPHGRQIESQFMRRLFAGRLDRSNEWNWRETPDPQAAHALWCALTQAM